MTLGTLFWLFVAGFATWHWWRAKAIKDFVLQAARNYCKKMDVMLLDDAVSAARATAREAQPPQ